MAAEKFQVYLEQRGVATDLPTSAAVVTTPSSPLIWTAGEYPLVELIYGLYEVEVFKGNQTTLKAIADDLSKMWSITLTQDISRTWTDIRNRVKGPDVYLQKMALGIRKRAKRQ